MELDFYGDKINYIHAKFGDLRKCYNFTDDFMNRYPRFCEEYVKYFWCEDSLFKNPYEIVRYIIYYDIPVLGYYNMSDTPAKDWYEVREYLNREYMGNDKLYNVLRDKETNKFYYVSLDNDKVEF